MASSPKAGEEKDIKQARRRLSVMSDNKLVEGFADSVNLDDDEVVAAGSSGCIVNSYGGYSKKGYAPYNPKKKNQDALIMAEDPKTRSLLFCVMDGHGEDGDKVSQSIKSKFANYLFKHRDFGTDIRAALTEVIQRCEAEVLRELPLKPTSPEQLLLALLSATTSVFSATSVTPELPSVSVTRMAE